MRTRLLFPIIMLLALTGCSAKEEQKREGESVILSRTLSNGKVNAFCEDKSGHIWIGTFRGLNKFDNHLFHQYLKQGDEDGLSGNIIIDLHSDKKGRLWVATIAGTDCLDRDGDFVHYGSESENQGASSIMETPSGGILLNYVTHFCLLDEESKVFKTVLKDIACLGTRTAAVAPDGNLWIASLTDLLCYDTADFKLLWRGQLPHLVNHVAIDGNGTLWLAGEGKLSSFDTRIKQFAAPVPLPVKGELDLMYPLGDGGFLLNTIADGLFLYLPDSGRSVHQSSPEFPFALPSGHVRCIFQDSSGNLWFGSEDQGYMVASSTSGPFNNEYKYLRDSFKGKSVVSLALAGEDRLFVSTLQDGLYCYALGDRRLEKLDLDYAAVDVVYPDSNGNIWLVLKKDNLVVKGKLSGTRFVPERKWQVFYPMDITRDSAGKMWVSTGSRDLLCLGGDGAATPLTMFAEPLWTYTPTLVALPAERLLAASYDAPLTLVDCRSASASKAPVPQEWEQGFGSQPRIPIVLKADSRSQIWYGTLGAGLFLYNLPSGEMTPVTGAPCLDISAVEEDSDGNIWVSTMAGLGKWERESGKFTNYFSEDGIGGDQFYERSACALPDGCILFGGTHGLTVVNPSHAFNQISAPLVFEDLKVHNTHRKDLSAASGIRLKYKDNGFSISFASLSYAVEAKPRYSYMMGGFDKYWVDAGTTNEAYYGNLPPGKYRFIVRATMADKERILAESAMDVRILPPFWLSWWMKVIYVLLLLALLWAFLNLLRGIVRERDAKELALKEKEQEERLSKAQMTFFSNIAHEFRTPLTMIAGPVSEMERSEKISGNDRKLLSAAGRSVNWMLSLVNQMLDFGKLEDAGLKLHVSKHDVRETLSPLVEMFSQHARAKGLEFNVRGLEESFVMWLDEDKLRKIMMNLLSNAMKFTPSGGSVLLSFDTSDSRALLTVSDTGCGIPEEQREKIFERYYQVKDGYNWGSGIGLYYARALAQLHHGSIEVSGRDDGLSGAVFTVALPIAGASYTDEEKAPVPDAPQPFIHHPAYQEDNPGTPLDGRKAVLVADDDVDIANYLKLILGRIYEVSVCYDAEAALKMLGEKEFDLVISDVMMPGKSGYDLCAALKQDIGTCHIPVILVTAKTSVSDQVRGLDSGADAYVTKPFDTQYLLALMRSLLDNRDKMRGRIGKVTSASEIKDDEMSPQDKAFMKSLYELMESTLSDPDIDQGTISGMMKMSRTKFYYKVKGLTGESPNVFFRRFKLNRAAELLLEGKLNVSEIADKTGFATLSHFSATFKKQFGVPPSEYKG